MKKICKSIFKRLHTITLDRSGYNLIELMIVIAIIGILAAVVGPQLFGLLDKSRASTAKMDMAAMVNAMDRYHAVDGNPYPTEEQGLKALFEKPTSDPIPENYPDKGYLKSAKPGFDPWGHPYIYKIPGSDGADYDIICLGADGKEGGKDYDTDIRVTGN